MTRAYVVDTDHNTRVIEWKQWVVPGTARRLMADGVEEELGNHLNTRSQCQERDRDGFSVPYRKDSTLKVTTMIIAPPGESLPATCPHRLRPDLPPHLIDPAAAVTRLKQEGAAATPEEQERAAYSYSWSKQEGAAAFAAHAENDDGMADDGTYADTCDIPATIYADAPLPDLSSSKGLPLRVDRCCCT
jgi:hypothetical protein